MTDEYCWTRSCVNEIPADILPLIWRICIVTFVLHQSINILCVCLHEYNPIDIKYSLLYNTTNYSIRSYENNIATSLIFLTQRSGDNIVQKSRAFSYRRTCQIEPLAVIYHFLVYIYMCIQTKCIYISQLYNKRTPFFSSVYFAENNWRYLLNISIENAPPVFETTTIYF